MIECDILWVLRQPIRKKIAKFVNFRTNLGVSYFRKSIFLWSKRFNEVSTICAWKGWKMLKKFLKLMRVDPLVIRAVRRDEKTKVIFEKLKIAHSGKNLEFLKRLWPAKSW